MAGKDKVDEQARVDSFGPVGEAGENVKPERTKSIEEITKEIDEAKKAALDSDGLPRLNDDGLRIGLDGENPVSNENPDPRVVRGVRLF